MRILSRSSSRRRSVVLGAVLVAAVGTAAAAQYGFPGHEPSIRNLAYDGRFAFARIRYATAPGGYYYRGLPAWAHGYTDAERNLMKIMREVSYLNAHVEDSVVMTLDDPSLQVSGRSMTEAGFWTLTDSRPWRFVRTEKAGSSSSTISATCRTTTAVRAGRIEANMRASPQGRFVDLDARSRSSICSSASSPSTSFLSTTIAIDRSCADSTRTTTRRSAS